MFFNAVVAYAGIEGVRMLWNHWRAPAPAATQEYVIKYVDGQIQKVKDEAGLQVIAGGGVTKQYVDEKVHVVKEAMNELAKATPSRRYVDDRIDAVNASVRATAAGLVDLSLIVKGQGTQPGIKDCGDGKC